MLEESDGSFFTTRLAIQLLVAVTADLTACRPVSSLSPSEEAAPVNRSAAPGPFLDAAFSGAPLTGAPFPAADADSGSESGAGDDIDADEDADDEADVPSPAWPSDAEPNPDRKPSEYGDPPFGLRPIWSAGSGTSPWESPWGPWDEPWSTSLTCWAAAFDARSPLSASMPSAWPSSVSPTMSSTLADGSAGVPRLVHAAPPWSLGTPGQKPRRALLP